jgi:hypothetical protein
MIDTANTAAPQGGRFDSDGSDAGRMFVELPSANGPPRLRLRGGFSFAEGVRALGRLRRLSQGDCIRGAPKGFPLAMAPDRF